MDQADPPYYLACYWASAWTDSSTESCFTRFSSGITCSPMRAAVPRQPHSDTTATPPRQGRGLSERHCPAGMFFYVVRELE
jgi:hypothetical protein